MDAYKGIKRKEMNEDFPSEQFVYGGKQDGTWKPPESLHALVCSANQLACLFVELRHMPDFFNFRLNDRFFTYSY